MGHRFVWLVIAALAVGVFERPAEARPYGMWRSCSYRPTYRIHWYVFEDYGECEELYDYDPPAPPMETQATVVVDTAVVTPTQDGGETCDPSQGQCISLNSLGDGPPGPSNPTSQAEVVDAINAMSPPPNDAPPPTTQDVVDAIAQDDQAVVDAIDAMSPPTTPPTNDDNVAAVVAAINEDAVAVALDGPAPTAATPSTPDSSTSTDGTTGTTGNSGNAPGDGDSPGPAGDGVGVGSADGTAF